MSDAVSSNLPVLNEPLTIPIMTEQYETLVEAGGFNQTHGQIELIHGRIVSMNRHRPSPTSKKQKGTGKNGDVKRMEANEWATLGLVLRIQETTHIPQSRRRVASHELPVPS
ncbi:hypothetical protein Poly51_27500 [Rubripirellula tenax]|uniref:Uncharacterized protein n=1 Tax=Rubripirellula tenax TaxID=2528015 RepID=A0A5C6F4Z6_9BACT|nr:hypothetical protein Poly51_27500 [Rubripirellula tenax]